LTYHVYYLEIDGQQFLNINESKQADKFGLIIFFVVDLFILIMIFYIRKQKITQHNSKIRGKSGKINLSNTHQK